MQEIDFVDFHIHSKFSIPSSKEMDIENLVSASKKKGITILGTGDILLDSWRSLIEKKLEFNKGFYNYNDFRFILTSEVNIFFEFQNSIKKFHAVLTFPTFREVDEFKKAFGKYSNFENSARPNIKISPKNFLEIVFSISRDIHIILAHIFTPYFGILGSKNNLESIDEVFESDTSSFIFLETGLSADPSMVFEIESLRKFVVLSSSDAHSLESIGREATATKKSNSYKDLFLNLRNRNNLFTIEDFPQLGKYYLDGHRKCNFKTDNFNVNICPVCGKPLTKGVLHRVKELSDGESPKKLFQNFYYAIPLKNILKKVVKRSDLEKTYNELLENYKNEYNVLLFTSLDDLKNNVNEKIFLLIKSVRENKLTFDCGFDGQYGDWEVLFA